MVEAAGFSPKVNILTLAAYERARRALRGECEPNSRAGKMRTNISNEPSANIVKMREVCSRPRRLRQNEKRPSKTVFLVEAAGFSAQPNISPLSAWQTSLPISEWDMRTQSARWQNANKYQQRTKRQHSEDARGVFSSSTASTK